MKMKKGTAAQGAIPVVRTAPFAPNTAHTKASGHVRKMAAGGGTGVGAKARVPQPEAEVKGA